MSPIKNICVFCGSRPGRTEVYLQAARELGASLGRAGLKLIYGSSDLGLMGTLAEAALTHGAEVTGIVPRALEERGLSHPPLTSLLIVDDMHTRKREMFTRADAFVAMPGGWGTLEELAEILTWSQLSFHQKPIGLLNTAGYYDKLLSFFAHMTREEFLQPSMMARLQVSQCPSTLLSLLTSPNSNTGQIPSPQALPKKTKHDA